MTCSLFEGGGVEKREWTLKSRNEALCFKKVTRRDKTLSAIFRKISALSMQKKLFTSSCCFIKRSTRKLEEVDLNQDLLSKIALLAYRPFHLHSLRRLQRLSQILKKSERLEGYYFNSVTFLIWKKCLIEKNFQLITGLVRSFRILMWIRWAQNHIHFLNAF